MRNRLPGPSEVLRGFTRAAVITVALVGVAQASGVAAQAGTDASAGVIAFVNDNLAPYAAAVQLASRKAPPPQVPVPPVVDFPCQACADAVQGAGALPQNTSPSEAVAQVKQWIQDSMEPEATQIQELLKVEKELTLLGCENGCGASEMLSADAVKALKKFGTADEINSEVSSLASRVWDGKVKPMYALYHKEPRQAFAGTQLILAVSRQTAMWGDKTAEDTAGQYINGWLQSVLDRIEQDAVNGHLYNLCPIYLSTLYAMGVMDDRAVINAPFQNLSDRIGATLQKLDKLMFFDMVVKLHAAGRSSDGGNMDITWMGKAKMRIEIERDHVMSSGHRILSPCFKPEILDGGKMHVNVVNFTMNGSSGGVQLISPHSFDAVLTNPQLNLCDPHPVLQVALSGMKYPQEVIQAAGAPPAKTNFLAPFLGTVSMTNELNRNQTNALTGNANHLSADQKANDQSVAGARQRMNSAQAEIAAHKGDAGWLMSAEGQAVIARLQTEAMGMVQPKLAAAGFDLPSADNAGQLGMSLASAHLQWTNGQSAPVFQTLKVQKNGLDLELTVSVENAPLQ